MSGEKDLQQLGIPHAYHFLQRAERIGLPIEKRITHRFPLSQLQQAFETTLRQEGVKIMVENI